MEYVLLVADNNPEFLSTWGTFLSGAGYHVTRAAKPGGGSPGAARRWSWPCNT